MMILDSGLGLLLGHPVERDRVLHATRKCFQVMTRSTWNRNSDKAE